MKHEYTFGKWAIAYDPPPIPARNCDWSYTHEDDDGAPDGYAGRSGHAESLNACLAAIEELQSDEHADALTTAEVRGIAIGLERAAKAIQGQIDTYSIAGANLLFWLTEDDLATMPRSHRVWWSLFRQHPSQREWEIWASDIACCATFDALRQAKATAIRQAIPKGTDDAE